MAPHSPAVVRASSGASLRQCSVSMRGTPAAQRMRHASYCARHTHSTSAASNTSLCTATPNTNSLSVPPRCLNASSSNTSPRSTPVDGPLYYVVGSAVVNPQLMVSPSVQNEIRGVSTLTTRPDAMQRPAIGPQLHNTHPPGTAPSWSRGNTASAAAATTSTSATVAGLTPVNSQESEEVVCVESIRSGRAAEINSPPYMQQAYEARTGSLAVLRQIYGTTAEDVIEVAQTNPRSGVLESPRMQYHTAQELLPELTSTEAQRKAMASTRRRIDWDASIPTAETLPPPVITFTTATGSPVASLATVLFTVDTSTLAMQRDYAAEKAMAASTSSCPAAAASLLKEILHASTAVTAATSTVNSNASRISAARAPLLQEEEKVGLDVTREDRLGSSGLYRIRHLVGLRQGLGEMVGLDRVLEYEVETTSSKLFIMQPSIDASSGDLLMELNTSLQGTAKLVITGVDCGSVDAETGALQRSSNTLTCYIALKHGVSAAQRERSLASLSMGAAPQYACVPSAAPRSPSARVNRAGAAFAGSSNTSRDNGGNDMAGSDGFALSLAHFSQDYTAADSPGSRNMSLSRDATATGSPGNDGAGGGGVDTARRNSLDVQSIVARSSALGEVGTCGSGGGSPVSGAYASARRSSGGLGSIGRRRSRNEAGSSRDGPLGGGAHYLFPLTNPHDLRYRQYSEAVRLCRLQCYMRQQQVKEQEKLEKSQLATASKSFPGTNAISHSNSTPQRGSGAAQNANDVNNWSDDEEDREMSRGRSEESQGRSQESPTTTAEEKKRSRRKSVVEILELEEEFDHHSPLAVPTMTGLTFAQGSHRSMSGGSNGGARRVPSAQHLRASPRHSSGGSGGSDGSGGENAGATVSFGEDERELRRPCTPGTLFCMNTVQSPVSYLRLTVWQDRLLLLFTEADKELLRSDQRARFKREARQELTEGALAGMLNISFAWSTNPSNSGGMGGRKLSMQSRRGPSTINTRNFSPTSSTGGGGDQSSHSSAPCSSYANSNNNNNNNNKAGSGGMSRPTNGSSSGSESGSASTGRPFTVIRQLILCLALEEERSSVQLYADVVQLCSHLSHSALLKTTSLTRGTREGLQQAAAAVLAVGASAQPPKVKAGAAAAKATAALPVWEGNSTLSASDRESLRLLSDTLELAMTVTLLIGAYGNAVEYAVQRVHTLCLLEGDTTAVVNAAQRDLVEVYLFYGDYATAFTIAQDVVMLTEQLCTTTPDAHEVAEAEALCALACVAAGRRDRIAHYIERLELSVVPMEQDGDGATTIPLPHLQAQLRLVLCFAKMQVAYAGDLASASATADMVSLAREAVRLLRGDGDLQEMEQSFSTVFPGQARALANMEGSSTNIPLSMRGRLASMVSCSVTAGPLPANRSMADLNGSDAAVTMMVAQKRLRWNLLSFAGALLMENGETDEGIEVMESTVKELVLGQHRYVERTHRASIASILWVGLVLAKSWAQPTSKEDFVSMLKAVASRVVRVKGPLHPFAAVANLQYANIAHHSLNSRHGLSLVARSLAVLESTVSPQSHYLLVAHYVFGSMAESQQRWLPALEHLSAAYAIAQASHLCDKDLLELNARFLGALLNCPASSVVEVDVTALRRHTEACLERTRQFAGPHSEALVEPLWNMADLHYLLRQPANALECLQQAVRLLDRRGILFASSDVLRPIDTLRLEHQQHQEQQQTSAGAEEGSVQQLVHQRNALVLTSLDSVHQALRLADTLYMLGAVLESQARTAEAEEKYGQCLAIYEALQLGNNSLSAARIMTTIAKLMYTTARCGEALSWAHKAELLLHIHYRKQWPLELEGAEKLVAIVERRLYEEEGTYVVQSDVPSQDGLPRLI